MAIVCYDRAADINYNKNIKLCTVEPNTHIAHMEANIRLALNMGAAHGKNTRKKNAQDDDNDSCRSCCAVSLQEQRVSSLRFIKIALLHSHIL